MKFKRDFVFTLLAEFWIKLKYSTLTRLNRGQ